MLSKVNHADRLYVIEENIGKEKGFSCLGFEVLDRRAKRLADELGLEWDTSFPHGTEKYGMYQDLLGIAYRKFQRTGKRFECELHPKLHDCLHERVEVTFEDGTKERFRVGKSTGWTPIYLRLANSRSISGSAIDADEKIVRVRQIS